MKQIRQQLCRSLTAMILILSLATPARSWFVFDVMRTGQFSIQGVQRLLNTITEYEKVYIKQQEVLMRKLKAAISEADLPKAQVYEFLQEHNIMEMGSEEYLPATTDTAAAEAYIREKFFFPSDETKLTEQEKEKIIQRRYAYLEALSKEILSLSAALKEQTAKEQEVLKNAKTTGSGVQQIELLVQNKKVMVEQQAVSVLLQAKIFELEAAQMMMTLNPKLMEKPAE